MVTEAIKLCYERSSDFIHEYLEHNFDLSAFRQRMRNFTTRTPKGHTLTLQIRSGREY